MRRYKSLRQSFGTTVPASLRLSVLLRDHGCVGRGRLPGECSGSLQLDHVRASHAMGMKSPTEASNLVSLCGAHHRYKTEHGRESRPVLLDYLGLVEGGVDGPR